LINITSTSTFTIPKENNLENKDTILLPKKIQGGYIFAIADGVGKKKGAKLASKTAIEYLDKINDIKELSDIILVFNMIKTILVNISNKDESIKDMATTLTLCIISPTYIKVAHTGDCRLYIDKYKNKKLIQLTNDQSEHQKLLKDGVFTKEELKNHPRKHALSSALSPNMKVEVEEKEEKILSEEMSIFIMSDGAYNYYEDDSDYYKLSLANINEFSFKLEQDILKKGAKDDSSFIAVKILKSKEQNKYSNDKNKI